MDQSQDRAGTGAEPDRRTLPSVWLDGESNTKRRKETNMASKPRNRQAEIVAEWLQATTATEANAAELAHLDHLRMALEGVSAEFQSLTSQHDALAASRQDISRRREDLLVEGNRIAAFLRAGARQHYGPDSEKLVEFGIKPARGRRRKKVEPEIPEEPPPPPTGSPVE